jgi:hypothetical protein
MKVHLFLRTCVRPSCSCLGVNSFEVCITMSLFLARILDRGGEMIIDNINHGRPSGKGCYCAKTIERK